MKGGQSQAESYPRVEPQDRYDIFVSVFGESGGERGSPQIEVYVSLKLVNCALGQNWLSEIFLHFQKINSEN